MKIEYHLVVAMLCNGGTGDAGGNGSLANPSTANMTSGNMTGSEGQVVQAHTV
jgi:hypothetical protein